MVAPRRTDPKAPAHLSARGKQLWRTLTEAYVFGAHELELLRVGLEALDRCEEARRLIAEEGSVFRDRFGQPKQHPATRVEAESRLQYVKCMRELALDPEAVPESRPPSMRGRYKDRR